MKIKKFSKLTIISRLDGNLYIMWADKIIYERRDFVLPQPKKWLKRKGLWLVDTITQRKIYGWYAATDCDHCHVEFPCQYDNRKAWDYAQEHLYDDAEGATSLCRISKAEYLGCKEERVCRDYALEAHENGNPYNVRG